MTSERVDLHDDPFGAVPHDDIPKIVSILGATGSDRPLHGADPRASSRPLPGLRCRGRP